MRVAWPAARRAERFGEVHHGGRASGDGNFRRELHGKRAPRGVLWPVPFREFGALRHVNTAAGIAYFERMLRLGYAVGKQQDNIFVLPRVGCGERFDLGIEVGLAAAQQHPLNGPRYRVGNRHSAAIKNGPLANGNLRLADGVRILPFS